MNGFRESVVVQGMSGAAFAQVRKALRHIYALETVLEEAQEADEVISLVDDGTVATEQLSRVHESFAKAQAETRRLIEELRISPSEFVLRFLANQGLTSGIVIAHGGAPYRVEKLSVQDTGPSGVQVTMALESAEGTKAEEKFDLEDGITLQVYSLQ